MKNNKSLLKRIKIKKKFLQRNKACKKHFLSKKSTGSRFNLNLKDKFKLIKTIKKLISGIKLLNC